jgi:TP901 family phage tail tape measure protein
VLAAGLAVKSALGFEEQMSDVAIAFGVMGKAGEESLAALEAKAMELGRTTRFTAAQAAKSLHTLGLGGLSVAQAMSTLDDVMNLAAATGLELSASAQMVIDNMIKYGIAANDTTRIVDNLAAAQNAVQISAANLAEAHRSLGATTANMGATFEDTSKILLGIMKSGQLPGEAGTALGVGLGRLIQLPKEGDSQTPALSGYLKKWLGSISRRVTSPTSSGHVDGRSVVSSGSSKMTWLALTTDGSKSKRLKMRSDLQPWPPASRWSVASAPS